MSNLFISRCLLVFLVLALVVSTAFASPVATAPPQTSLEQLEKTLVSQYARIERQIAAPPSRAEHPDNWRVVLRAWQDELANLFAKAAETVEEVLKLNPENPAMWHERLETLRLYSRPISSPDQRAIYGAGEVQKPARVLEAPAALYTEAARVETTKGEVRIRLVLAADGTVKNVFPIKSLRHGLTESAIQAARQIKFEPAIRNGQPASQFETFVYEFKRGSAKPYIPRTVF